MAFDVTPTSGGQPYTFTADFLNKEAFDYGYQLRFGITTGEGACPAPELAVNYVSPASNALLQEGVYVRTTGSVQAGFCSTFKLEILDENENVIDMQFVNVSNI